MPEDRLIVAAGFGMRREVGTSELVALFNSALAQSGLERDAISCFATLTDRTALPAFRAAVIHFGAATRIVTRGEMARVKHRIVTHSPEVERLYGVGSVAEAVALIAAGSDSQILLPRIVSPAATCALAAPPA
ncbi:cobalamin biosynthesis protein [Lutibaculum baratangense]|nr:cobalamin biosynthesis protein [Lutibaculum baratangense]